MSILQEIHDWSQHLPAWQQDAVARLYANRTLGSSDYDDLFALAKSEKGLDDPKKRVPQKLGAAQVATQPVPSRVVQLVSIKEISNVNALADGASLPLSPTGLTVIYGENGTGKSGYSRVLKRACRARDQTESILPDANKKPGTTGPAKAVFEALVNGKPQDFGWQNGAAAPEELSELSIFDSHCARAYIDNQGDFSYIPYGLDILEGLVVACNTVKERTVAEKANSAPNVAVFAALAKTSTKVGAALTAIPGATRAADIEALATMTDAEAARLAELNKALVEADPKQKALALRQKATRLANLTTRMGTAIALVNAEKLSNLRTLIDISNGAKHAAELAAKDFKEAPGQLPGTGGEEWKSLFESARDYALISHVDHAFPNLPAQSPCPLCQNELGQAGADRLVRFEAFVQQAAEKTAKDAKAKAVEAYRDIEHATLDLSIDETLAQEVSEISADLAKTCADLQTVLNVRRDGALQASGGKLEWGQIPHMGVDPRAMLDVAVATLQSRATTLQESMDEKAKAAMVAEQAELEARRRLGELKSAVLDAIAKHENCAKLQACIEGLATMTISRKSTELSKTMANQEVADALNAELKSLNVHELQVVMKPESPGGRTKFKLALQLPSGGAPSAILSEGEQRAIAIASFLAEVKLGKGRGGIVFDDPVSSLDHRRRWEVATRLATEAHHRQVIVFTHDIYFLCILQQKAEELGAPLTAQYIRRTGKGYGVRAPSLPFDTLNTKARVGRLRQWLATLERAHKNGEEDDAKRLTRDIYRHLRLAWERSIEEVLFDSVVQRFGEVVSTQRLKRVTVEDEDYKEIDAGMSKSSKFEHDAAATVHLPTPHPDEVKDDIDRLDTWRLKVESRKDATAAKRK